MLWGFLFFLQHSGVFSVLSCLPASFTLFCVEIECQTDHDSLCFLWSRLTSGLMVFNCVRGWRAVLRPRAVALCRRQKGMLFPRLLAHQY